MKVFHRRPRTEVETIRQQYRDQIVDGATGRSEPAGAPVDVPTIDVLARLARQAERPMAHVPSALPGKDEFHVDDFGMRYRYLADARLPDEPHA